MVPRVAVTMDGLVETGSRRDTPRAWDRRWPRAASARARCSPRARNAQRAEQPRARRRRVLCAAAIAASRSIANGIKHEQRQEADTFGDHTEVPRPPSRSCTSATPARAAVTQQAVQTQRRPETQRRVDLRLPCLPHELHGEQQRQRGRDARSRDSTGGGRDRRPARRSRTREQRRQQERDAQRARRLQRTPRSTRRTTAACRHTARRRPAAATIRRSRPCRARSSAKRGSSAGQGSRRPMPVAMSSSARPSSHKISRTKPCWTSSARKNQSRLVHLRRPLARMPSNMQMDSDVASCGADAFRRDAFYAWLRSRWTAGVAPCAPTSLFALGVLRSSWAAACTTCNSGTRQSTRCGTRAPARRCSWFRCSSSSCALQALLLLLVPTRIGCCGSPPACCS